jgi:hypothetical protein
MRVSDADRQAAAERLRGALAEGRLDFSEYDDRLAKAFQAVTYADLDQLFTDLPVQASTQFGAPPRPAPPEVARRAAVGLRAAGLPTPLKILWTIWSCTVLINLTVWLLVSLGNGEPDYFWPMWLFVPGAALFGATVIVNSVRWHR